MFTDRGVVFKAGKRHVRDENKRRKEAEDSAERLKYIYQIVLLGMGSRIVQAE